MNALSGCQRCGRAVNAGAQFCSNCGADVSSEQGLAATRRMTPASATSVMHNQLLDRLRRASLGEYEILAELGRGGMASVFLAHDLQLDRKVAIKVMLPSLLEGEGMAERFKLEARTAANLSHPHIIPIFAVRDTDLLIYFVMKFVEGRPLDTIIREVGKLPIPMAQTILSKVGEALGYAHRQGVVHRDIKPANLMIDVEGQPIVTDFGIAKVAEMSGLTMTGATIGTPTYMSPEQATASPITGASDQYSLGIVAYQMLSGHLPFNGETMVSLLYQHCHEPPPPFLAERPDCPPELHDAVMRMLAKKPEDRFPNLEEAVECIGRVSLSFDDPVRTQLVDLAMKGGNRRILEGVRTPRSPIPTRAKATNRGASSSPEPIVPTRELPAKSRAPLWVALATVAVVGAGLGVWRPWVSGPDAGVGAPGAASGTASGAASAAVASLSVSPPSGSLDVNGSLQLQAAARDANGQPVSVSIIWTSADSAIATVSPTGLVLARAPGTIAIRASAGGMASTALLTVAPSGPKAAVVPTPAGATAVASIRVDGVPSSMSVGGTAQLRASALDGRGATMTGRAVRWTSADPARARVTATGLVTGLAAGDAVLVASSESVDRSVTIQILAQRPASVQVTSLAGPLTVGSSARLTAVTLGDDGRAMDAPVSWRSADSRVATVSGGVVTAVGPGSTSIIATADGLEGSTTVRVAADESARPAADPPRPAAPVDPRQAVEAAIQSYARALESRQISEVRKVYPGIQPEQETQLAQTLRSMDQLKMTLRVLAVDIQGNTATANISQRYDFFSRDNRRNESIAVDVVATLENGANGWMIRQIRTAR